MPKNPPEHNDTSGQRKRCFIIGPIGSEGTDTRRNADFLLQGIIEEALKDTLYDVVRVDRVSSVGSITTDIVNHIIDSDLIIADLSEHNPNAFYELGIAHANRKVVIHVCRKGFSIPFDTSHERTVFFDLSDWKEIVAAREALISMVEFVSDASFVVSNPYTVATDLKRLGDGDIKDKKIAEISKENERLIIENENIQQDLKRINNHHVKRLVEEAMLSKEVIRNTASGLAPLFKNKDDDGYGDRLDKKNGEQEFWDRKRRMKVIVDLDNLKK